MLGHTCIHTNRSVIARPDELESFWIMLDAVTYEALTEGCCFDVVLTLIVPNATVGAVVISQVTSVSIRITFWRCPVGKFRLKKC